VKTEAILEWTIEGVDGVLTRLGEATSGTGGVRLAIIRQRDRGQCDHQRGTSTAVD
jgi:hypothetical protein